MKQKKPIQRKSIKLPKHLQNLNPYAAGIDIVSKSHFVAVPEGTATNSQCGSSQALPMTLNALLSG